MARTTSETGAPRSAAGARRDATTERGSNRRGASSRAPGATSSLAHDYARTHAASYEGERADGLHVFRTQDGGREGLSGLALRHAGVLPVPSRAG